MRIRNNKKAMTAVEMLVSISILAILSLGVTGMLTQCLRGWGNGAASEAANSYATVALQRLSFDVREGRSAVVTNGRLVVTFPLVLTDPTTGEKLYDSTANDPVTRSYYVTGGNLVRLKNGVTSVLARGISSSSTFTAAAGYVDVALVSDQQMGTTVKTHQATGHIALRNSQL